MLCCATSPSLATGAQVVSLVASGSFAELLRSHRLAAGLTQAALAEIAGLSEHGIQRLESGASRPYRDTVTRLVRALRLSQDEAAALEGAVPLAPRNRRPGATAPPVDARHNLPCALTSFIGREQEKDELTELLVGTRLLTLTGVGGCGKTRLALEVGRLVYDRYPEGVWLVDLATITDPDLVPQAIATIVSVPESPGQSALATLSTVLKSRRTLLLLDNCEHLLGACAHIANTLLLACPGLQIVATSREALGVVGEVCRGVPSLPVPPPEPRTGNSVADYAAVQLFVDRARAVQPTFDISERNAAAIGQICRRLDGIPLALELAAALVRALSVEQLAARLDQRFQLLTGGNRAALPRQQTLRAAVDWSYALLTEAERALFARLSVFAVDWDLEAAETVCAGDGIVREQVVKLLLHLVDKSLVVPSDAITGDDRYRLLETLRQYGRERLLESGESDAVRSRHASYYVALAERAEPELDRSRQAEWIERLALEQGEIRAALEWLVARGEIQEALRLAGVMSRFWEIRGHLREGRARLEQLLTLTATSAPTVVRAEALDAAGVLALYQVDFAAARALFKESLAFYRRHKHLPRAAWVIIHLGWMCHDSGRYRAARRFLDEALTVCHQVDDRRGIARCFTILGMIAESELDLAAARSYHERSLALNREVGDRWGAAWALDNLGRTLLAEAELGRADARAAEELLEDAVATWRELGERRHLAYSMSDLATCSAWRGDAKRARRQLGEALTTFTELQDSGGKVNALWNWGRLLTSEGDYLQAARLLGAIYGYERTLGKKIWCCAALGQHHLEFLRSNADPDLVAKAFADGQRMTLDAAVQHAHEQLAGS